MNDMTINWRFCTGNVWCKLMTVNLNHETFKDLNGVYIIWKYDVNNIPRTIRLGQGIIKDRLNTHRLNEDITKYNLPDSELYVTWAAVDGRSVDGVEAYLARVLNPVIGERFPLRTEKSVNLPW